MIKAWAWADLTQAGLSFLLRNGNKTLADLALGLRSPFKT